MTMNQTIAEHTYNELVNKWGEEPSWETFLKASKEGKIVVDKTVATQAFTGGHINGTLTVINSLILYSAIILGIAPIIFYFWLGVSGWWIIGGILGGWFLKAYAREQQVEAVKAYAEQSESFYKKLIRAGAFRF